MQWTTLCATAILALLAGCAATPGPQAPEAGPLYFPPPPEQPRFVYERTVRGSTDIQKLDSKDRMRLMLTGESEEGNALAKPFDVSVCQGQVYISDTVRRSVMVFDVPGQTFFELGLEEPGTLSKPLGLDTDDDCNVYVADGTTRRVLVYDQSGRFLKALGGQQWFERLSHVAVDGNGSRVYAVDTGGVTTEAHYVRVFDVASGEHLNDIGKRGSEPDQFNLPRDIEVGPDGNLYIVDGGNFRVQVFTPQGGYIRSIGSLGRRYGQFARPKGIALDTEGNIYVSDAAHGNFQIFDAAGQLLLFVGERSEKYDRATYMLPAGIDVDEDGRVYMIDQYFRKLDVYRPAVLPETGGYLGAWPAL
ncbi:MAG: 6-bladed beta-propeller [Gammaproteobacteria bacterium]